MLAETHYTDRNRDLAALPKAHQAIGPRPVREAAEYRLGVS
jgi:hypothetical protein